MLTEPQLFFRSEWVMPAAYALVGMGTFLIARMFLQEQETRAAQENLDENRNRKASDPILKFTRPFFTQYVVPLVRGKPIWDDRRKVLKRKIITAGLKEELTSDELLAFKFFLIIFFPITFGFLRAFDFLSLDWTFILASGAGGWFYPDLWVNSRIKTRQKQILRSMPFIVDLLALSTEAGLDFMAAIGKVVEKAASSPLVDEFDQLLKEIKVGSGRADALREMAVRIGMTEINSFVAILISADQMGASIGKILRQQSEQIRVERMLRAEKEGAKAITKLYAPLMLFIFPAVLLMVMGPFFVGMISGPSASTGGATGFGF